MKKTLKVVIVIALLSLSFFAINKYRYVYHFYGGITVGGGSDRYDDNDPNESIDSIRVIAGKIYLYSGGDTLTIHIPASGYSDLFDYAARKYLTDTLLVTGRTATMDATWAGKVVRFSNATYCEVTVPANTMPAGSLVTLIRTSVAGPIRVNGAANVFRYSVLDSSTMNTAKQVYQILFRTTNKFEPLGNWTD